MSDPRMIPADEAQRVLDKISRGLTITDLDVPGLAHTVIEQAAQIERVRKVLRKIERADEQAQHDWDTKADMWAQGAAMGHSMAAQWLEEALGDTDDATNHAEQGEK